MPPCHGGDRRFESGRARQIKKPTLKVVFLIWESFNSRYELVDSAQQEHMRVSLRHAEANQLKRSRPTDPLVRETLQLVTSSYTKNF